jgi:hypothetical protein
MDHCYSQRRAIATIIAGSHEDLPLCDTAQAYRMASRARIEWAPRFGGNDRGCEWWHLGGNGNRWWQCVLPPASWFALVECMIVRQLTN